MSRTGAVFLLIGVLFWLGTLGWPRSLHIPDEGRYVGVAWDMVRFNSPWTPLLNSLPYFHKPPLFYWLSEYSFLLFGKTEWAARLPSILISWFTVMALYAFVRRHRGAEVATISVLTLVTMPYFYGASQYANLDMLVGGMISLTIMAAAEAVSRAVSGEPRAQWFAVAAGALAALAVLSKGLIGVVLPAGVIFFWLLATRRWRGFSVLLAPGVWLAFAAVALPWFIAMEVQYSGFLHYFFVYQQFERYLSAGFNQQQPVWFFLPVVLGMSLPWSIWLLRYFWQRGQIVFEASWFWLMMIWIVLIVVFFSIPDSKLIGYTVPVLPAVAVLIAEAIVGCWKGLRADRDVRWTAITFLAASFACLLALVIFLFANDRSARPFVRSQLQAMATNDQFVYVDVYPFDLAFYSGATSPAWVVYEWPVLPKGDTWRNELAEAGRFSPERAKEILITPAKLLPKICLSADQTYWFVGYPHDLDRMPFLKDVAAVFKQPHGVQFRKISVVPAFKQQWCQEKPREQPVQ